MITIPPTAKTVRWPLEVGDGYNFVADKKYKIHWQGSRAMIFAPDEIILNNGEVTANVLQAAIFES